MERRKPMDPADLLREMVRPMVAQPDMVMILGSGSEGYMLLTLQTAPEDTGTVIGKGGRVARSLRTVLSQAGRKMGLRVDLNIVDDRKPT